MPSLLSLKELPGDYLSLKPLISCLISGGISKSSGVDAGAAGGSVGVGKGANSTTPSSWTVWRGEMWHWGVVPHRPHIRVVIIGGNGKHPLAFVRRGYGRNASYSQWDCNDGKG